MRLHAKNAATKLDVNVAEKFICRVRMRDSPALFVRRFSRNSTVPGVMEKLSDLSPKDHLE